MELPLGARACECSAQDQPLPAIRLLTPGGSRGLLPQKQLGGTVCNSNVRMPCMHNVHTDSRDPFQNDHMHRTHRGQVNVSFQGKGLTTLEVIC